MRFVQFRRMFCVGCSLVASLFLANQARACLNTGTLEPCHCVQDMMMSVLRAAEPAVSPTLTGSLQSADATAQPPSITRAVAVGDTYYHSDDGNLFGNVTIQVGDTVHWAFVSGFHTVTSVPNSPLQWGSPQGTGFPGDTYDYTFMQPGVYEYYCLVHDFLSGDQVSGPQIGFVTVQAAPEPGCATLLAIGAMAMLAKRRKR